MPKISNHIQDALNEDLISKLSELTSSKPSEVRTSSEQAVSIMLAALAKESRSEDGAKALNEALEKDHDGSILDDIRGYLFEGKGDEKTTDSDGILTHLFGDKRSLVQAHLSKQTGLNEDMVNQLLKKLAPLVMGALGKKKQSGEGLDLDQLSEQLMSEAKEISPSPNILETLSALLDKDKYRDRVEDAKNFIERDNNPKRDIYRSNK